MKKREESRSCKVTNRRSFLRREGLFALGAMTGLLSAGKVLESQTKKRTSNMKELAEEPRFRKLVESGAIERLDRLTSTEVRVIRSMDNEEIECLARVGRKMREAARADDTEGEVNPNFIV